MLGIKVLAVGGAGPETPGPQSVSSCARLAAVAGADVSFLFSRAGSEVVVPCSSGPPVSCSNVTWLYNRDRFLTVEVVEDGNVKELSGRGSRPSLDKNCSLVIDEVSEEDAGSYTCRQGRLDAQVYLSLLTGESGRSIDVGPVINQLP